MCESGREVTPELVDALRGRPATVQPSTNAGLNFECSSVEERLRLLERCLRSSLMLMFVVERAPTIGIATFSFRELLDLAELPLEFLGESLFVIQASASRATRRKLRSTMASLALAPPFHVEPGRVRRDPDRARLLDRARLDRHALELVELAA